MTRPHVFVTGASGLLGSRTLSELLRRRPDARASVLVRDPRRWARAAHRASIPLDRVTVLRGDITAPRLGLAHSARDRVAAVTTHVLHAAGDVRFSQSLTNARRVHVTGTRHLLGLMSGWPAVRSLVHVSTAFAVGMRTGRIREERGPTPPGWVNAYERSKWEGEEVVRASAVPWTIVRPSTVVCDDASGHISRRDAVHRALRLQRAGLAALLPGSPETPVDLVPADWVARGLAAAVWSPGLLGRTLHLCAGKGALRLDALLAGAHRVWSACPDWHRRGVALPALTTLRAYRLFERSLEDTASPRLQRVARGLSSFVPQLAHPKRFDTDAGDRVAGGAAPAVRGYWPRVVAALEPAGHAGPHTPTTRDGQSEAA